MFTLGTLFIAQSCGNLVNQATLAGTEDAYYLTPIPEGTIESFQEGTPVVTKLQAVIAARAYLRSTRLYFQETPRVIFVQEDPPGAWQVVFEGDYQVIGPDPEHTVTPPAPKHGCVLLEFEAKGGQGLRVKTVECSAWR